MSRRRLLVLIHAISIEYIAWLRHRLRKMMFRSMYAVASIVINFRTWMKEGGNSVLQTLMIPASVSECGAKCSRGYIIISIINNMRT